MLRSEALSNPLHLEYLDLHLILRLSLQSLILSCWLSISINALLGLEENADRHNWFVIDELASLQKLSELNTLLSEGRKYGGCALLSTQNLSQLEKIYGLHDKIDLLSNCNTRFVFREKSPESAKEISWGFGNKEILENREGTSYGANTIEMELI